LGFELGVAGWGGGDGEEVFGGEGGGEFGEVQGDRGEFGKFDGGLFLGIGGGFGWACLGGGGGSHFEHGEFTGLLALGRGGEEEFANGKAGGGEEADEAGGEAGEGDGEDPAEGEGGAFGIGLGRAGAGADRFSDSVDCPWGTLVKQGWRFQMGEGGHGVRGRDGRREKTIGQETAAVKTLLRPIRKILVDGESIVLKMATVVIETQSHILCLTLKSPLHSLAD
jgi:hypothetical protein